MGPPCAGDVAVVSPETERLLALAMAESDAYTDEEVMRACLTAIAEEGERGSATTARECLNYLRTRKTHP